jgi:flagellar basal body-associated protein FliL
MESLENNTAAPEQEETTVEVRGRLVRYFSSRRDMGLDKILLNLAFQPANPFDPKRKRKFRKGFVLLLLVVLALVATFVYFNIYPGAQ